MFCSQGLLGFSIFSRGIFSFYLCIHVPMDIRLFPNNQLDNHM